MALRTRYLPLTVLALNRRSMRGRLALGTLSWPVSLGRSGLGPLKREGDGRTPSGRWPLREMLYRRDRMLPPRTGLPKRAIAARDGWCDAVADRNYNRRVVHPYPASAEHLWRTDRLYDVVVVVGYNDAPRLKGRGSAIFLHLERPDRGPTAGCIALSPRDMARLLSNVSPRTRLLVPPARALPSPVRSSTVHPRQR